jgi:hypothetical protein
MSVVGRGVRHVILLLLLSIILHSYIKVLIILVLDNIFKLSLRNKASSWDKAILLEEVVLNPTWYTWLLQDLEPPLTADMDPSSLRRSAVSIGLGRRKKHKLFRMRDRWGM